MGRVTAPPGTTYWSLARWAIHSQGVFRRHICGDLQPVIAALWEMWVFVLVLLNALTMIELKWMVPVSMSPGAMNKKFDFRQKSNFPGFDLAVRWEILDLNQ